MSLACLSGIMLKNCNFSFNINLSRCEWYIQRWWLDTSERNTGSISDKHFFERLHSYGRKEEVYLPMDLRSRALSLVAHTLPQLFLVKFVLCFKRMALSCLMKHWKSARMKQISNYDIMHRFILDALYCLSVLNISLPPHVQTIPHYAVGPDSERKFLSLLPALLALFY